MRAILLLTICPLTLALAGCGSEQSGEFTTEDGETGEYTIDSETGETSATITTPDGEAVLRSGANVPVDLPGGFTVYPGAKVVTNTEVTHDGGKGSMLMLETDASPDEVVAHYRKQAEAADVEIQLEMSMNGGQMIGGEGPDGTTFTLNASAGDEGKTEAQLILGQGLDN
ncbi:MAG: hypothetical protein AAF941_07790 [Pseudomonadota bacterium]